MIFRTRVPSSIELETERAVRELKNHAIGSEEYVKTLNVVVTLHGMKTYERPTYVSRDTIAVVGANLLGILMIIKHESVNVVTSKAMNMVLKPRI